MDAFITFIKKLTGNMGLKIVSLGLAFLLWLFVVSIENPVMTLSFTSIPVSIENAGVMEDQGKAFELSDSSRTVTVSVKAERSVLSELSRDNIKASINMADLEGNKVPIEVKSTRYADRIQSISPSKEFANVVIENLLASQFRVIAEAVGNVPDGYSVGSSSVQNNVVRVSGPESIVSSIAEAVARVNVTGMTSEIHTAVPILLLDRNGDPVDTTALEVSIDQASVSVEIWKVVEIPIYAEYSGMPAAGYLANGDVTVTPASVYVTGESSALNKVDSITIPETEVDITGAEGDYKTEVDVSRYLPAGVYFDDSNDSAIVSVKVGVEAASATVLQVPYSNLTAVGLPEGMFIGNDMTNSMVAVTVRGLKQNIENLDGNLIVGTLNLSDLPLNENGSVTPGSYAGAVILALPENVSQDAAVAHVLLQVNGENPEAETQEGEAESEAGGEEESEERPAE